MPNVDRQKYTRYINEHNLDDEEEYFEEACTNIRSGADHGQQGQDGDYDQSHQQMQEARRVLAMMTPKINQHTSIISPTEKNRLICTLVLTAVLCLTGGALFGYNVGNKYSSESATTTTSSNYGLPSDASTSSLTSVTPTQSPKTENSDHTANIAKDFLSHFNPQLIESHIRNISKMKTYNLRDDIQKVFERQGFKVQTRMFPVMSSVADKKNPNTVEIVLKDNSSTVVNQATNSLEGFTPYSPFSPNGTASGPLVYAHLASDQDFNILRDNNVTVNGSIVLIRLAADKHPGVQARNAEKRGALGVLLYPDPQDFGSGGITLPVNSTDLQDGSLPLDGVVWQNLRLQPGDPSTPSVASQKGIYRIPEHQYAGVSSIIVQPVSADTAKVLFSILKRGALVPESWSGGLKGTLYSFGGSFKDNVKEVKMATHNRIQEEYTYAMVAYLPALDHSKVVHVGCHYDVRDSRITSSGLGLASLLALGDALQKTFPNGTERLIALTVFDGKNGDFSAGNEYSQLSSWWLESTAVAYIDLDEVLEGNGFVEANVSPILREVARDSLKHVNWANDEGVNAFKALTDASPFPIPTSDSKDQQHHSSSKRPFKFLNPYECDESVNFNAVHGIPSLQLTSTSFNKTTNGFHLKNSQYDSIENLITTQDKSFLWTHMSVSAMGLSALILATKPLPPANFNEVGWDLSKAWTSFLVDNGEALSKSVPSVDDLTMRISSEFETFILKCEEHDAWYNYGSDMDEASLSTEQKFRLLENRLTFLVNFGRRFQRPRNYNHEVNFGASVIFGPSAEDPCVGTYFPFISATLQNAVNSNRSWGYLHNELSILLGTLEDSYL